MYNDECVNFEIGDVVKVSSQLEDGKYYGDLYFNPKMKKYIGSAFIIKDYDFSGYYILQDIHDESTVEWKWNDDMLCFDDDSDREPASENEVDNLLM